jgi:hypothetical protein
VADDTDHALEKPHMNRQALLAGSLVEHQLPSAAQEIEPYAQHDTTLSGSARSQPGASKEISKSAGSLFPGVNVNTSRKNDAHVATTWEDFEFTFDRNFIFSAYQTLLARDPDEQGLAHYLLRLRRGQSKIEILSALLDSPEYRGREAHLRALQRALMTAENQPAGVESCVPIMNEPGSISPIGITTHEVIAYPALAFVTHVSHYSLGIRLDIQVITDYVNRMNAGLSKAQVLMELMTSQATTRRAALLSRIHYEMKRRRIARIPLVGMIIRAFLGIEGDSARELRLRRIENHLFANAPDDEHPERSPRSATSVASGEERQSSSKPEPEFESPSYTEHAPAAARRAATSLRSLPQPKKWIEGKDHV